MMRHGICLAIVGGVLAAVLAGGCRKTGTSPVAKAKPAPKMSLQEPSQPAKPTDKPASPEPAPPPEPKMPKVALTEKLLETCKLKVGDRLPDSTNLAGLDGKSVRTLFGPKATVVLFWSTANPYALQALEDLERDVAAAYGAKGVAVIGINVKDSAEAADKAVRSAGAKYRQLRDPQGDYFAQVATEGLPRLYLLDAEGTIVWFDVQYQESTRQDLLLALPALLGKSA